MPNKKAKAIPEPKEGTRTVFILKSPGQIHGVGNLSILCAKCDAVLLDRVAPGQFTDIVVKCPGCGTFNDV